MIGNDIGVLWCTVPAWQAYPDGTVIEAAEPARGCRGYNNLAVGGLWSYLVIDGARSSVLIQNESVAPALYDIELAAASERFASRRLLVRTVWSSPSAISSTTVLRTAPATTSSSVDPL